MEREGTPGGGTPGEREGTPGEVEVSNAFAVAGSLAHDLVPDSADQVIILYSHILQGPQPLKATALALTSLGCYLVGNYYIYETFLIVLLKCNPWTASAYIATCHFAPMTQCFFL